MATPSRTNPDHFSRVVHGILSRSLFGHALVDPRFQERPTDKAVRSQFGWFGLGAWRCSRSLSLW